MYTKSTIAVGNILVGVYNFMVLSHPEDWKLIPLPSSSESFSFTRRGDVKWVTRGVAEHGIRTPRGIIGLRIEVWPGKKDPNGLKELKNGESMGVVKLGDYEARVYWYKKRSLFTSSNALGLLVYCKDTDRSLLIEFIGGDEWIKEVLGYLGDSEC